MGLNAPGSAKFWWRKDNVPRKISFGGDSGVKVAVEEEESPIEISLLFTDDLIDHIVSETNW